MAWIESHQTLGRHPKTVRLATELHVRVPEAVGLLHFLWWWALDYAPDGLFGADNKTAIARACMWRGKPERFWNGLLTAGFVEPADVDGVLKIHDWMDYAGKLSEQRELRRESNRAAQQRRRQRHVSADAVMTSAMTHADSQQPTGPNRTGPNRTDAAAAASSRARERGEGGFQPIGSFLPRRRAAAAATNQISELPDEVRVRLARPPIHADG